jgi:transcription initiation factor TFIIE subunit alpha
VKEEESEDKKPAKDGDEDLMAGYWEELAKQQAEEAAKQAKESEDEDEDDDDDDEFEDVDVPRGTPLPNGLLGNGATGMSTPALESSNATDDERDTKRVKVEELAVASSSKLPNGDAGANGSIEKVAEDTPAASDEDEDELDFEDV